MNTDKKTKPATPSDFRRWNRCNRSWPKFAPQFRAAIDQLNRLGLFERETAYNHLVGGIHSVLQNDGAVSRKQFIALVAAAVAFAKPSPALPHPRESA